MFSPSLPGWLTRLLYPFRCNLPHDVGLMKGIGSARRWPSPSGTSLLAGEGGSITDFTGNTWQLTQNRQVALNGVADTATGSTIELAYINNKVWKQNSAQLWSSRTAETYWQPTAGTYVSPYTKTPPGQVLTLQTTAVTPTTISLHWQPPRQGAGPFTYSVQTRAAGATQWTEVARTTGTAAVVTGLTPGVTYSIEVLTTNI